MLSTADQLYETNHSKVNEATRHMMTAFRWQLQALVVVAPALVLQCKGKSALPRPCRMTQQLQLKLPEAPCEVDTLQLHLAASG